MSYGSYRILISKHETQDDALKAAKRAKTLERDGKLVWNGVRVEFHGKRNYQVTAEGNY